MCDYGRLNYKWIGREDRLTEVEVRSPKARSRRTLDGGAERNCGEAEAGAARVRSPSLPRRGRRMRNSSCSAKLAKKLGALTDSVPRVGEGDKLLLNADRNPNSTGARLIGICQPSRWASNLPKIAEGIRSGQHQDADCFRRRRDQARHWRGPARQAGDAHRQRHSAERDDEAGALPFARLRPRREARHVHQHQRPRAEIHEGRRAARRCAAGMGIPARPGLQRHRPGRFREHRRLVQRNGEGRARVQRFDVGGPRRHGRDGAAFRR